jgi:hypothetical protein
LAERDFLVWLRLVCHKLVLDWLRAVLDVVSPAAACKQQREGMMLEWGCWLVLRRMLQAATRSHNLSLLCSYWLVIWGRYQKSWKFHSQGGDKIDVETKSTKSVTWEVADKMERVWHFSEKDQSSYTPSLDLLEKISATPSRVSADLLHPQMSVGSSEKISVDLLHPEILSTLSGTGKLSVDLLHPEFVSAVSETERMSVDLLHPEFVSEKSGNRPVRFMAPESCSDKMETESKLSVDLLNESEKMSIDREKIFL